MELYKKHRPKTFKQMVGKTPALTALAKQIKTNQVPHALLFTGPSGCGKTTAARITASTFSSPDIIEMNCSDFRGIETVREIRDRAQFNSIYGDTRIWIIDEAHKLTNDAQNAFLKLLEDPPAHVYFMLCTTEPNKLIKTVKTRCTEIPLGLIPASELESLLQSVAEIEKFELTEDAMYTIIDCSEGSARKALVILETIMNLPEKEQLAAIPQVQEGPLDTIQICRLLFEFSKKPPSGADWKNLSGIIQDTQDEHETIRQVALRYFMSCLVKNPPDTAIGEFSVRLILGLSKPFFDSGKAGLLASLALVLFGED